MLTKADRPFVFISHSTQDASMAQVFKSWLSDNLSNAVRFFVSTDYESLPPGADFYSVIEDCLGNASMIVVLVTRKFLKSSWMFFEAGAAVSRRVPLVPVCCGIKISALPPPLTQKQAVRLESESDCYRLLCRIGELVPLEVTREKMSPFSFSGDKSDTLTVAAAPYELHHASIPVSDLAESKYFYGKILGLEEIDRPAFKFKGVEFSGAWYRLPSGQQLHLVVYPEGTPKQMHPERIPNSSEDLDFRNVHFALRVGDVYKMEERLKSEGIELICLAPSIRRLPQLYITDRDGNIVEINEWSELLP